MLYICKRLLLLLVLDLIIMD